MTPAPAGYDRRPGRRRGGRTAARSPPTVPDPPETRTAGPPLHAVPAAAAGLAWLVVFFAVPVFALGSTSLQTRVPAPRSASTRRPSGGRNYTDALSEYAPQFVRSFLYAGLATVLALAIGYPLAYAIALRAGRWRNLLLVLVIAPFFTSFMLRTIAWKQMLADGGVGRRRLRSCTCSGPSDHVLNTRSQSWPGITYNFLPFMMLPLYASLERLDPRLIEAAGDLYASAITTFRKVTLPLSMPASWPERC